ncbi:cellulose synthase-like protein G3 [Papaver somniferum]|uniref:cellulose synthase-like protein G3 n=1 Tax=Papaver somniferum TaxID=3469 RepID=UPI000E6F7A9B|nr:cellulose synthase-like protein G3 [Papaver somniferum]
MKNGEKTSAFPLNSYEVHPRTIPSRVFMLIYVCGIIALLYHHLTSLRIHSVDLLPSILLSIADLVLSFMWVACQAFRWCPVRRKVYPENLSKVVDEDDLPTLDVFICTADPYQEPPMEVVNTALSVLAFDYPSNKISVYVSDDGGSQMTLFALLQGAKFAREWLPFCRKHNLNKRCPKVAFNQHGSDADQLRSCIPQEEFLRMKIPTNFSGTPLSVVMSLKMVSYEEMRTKVKHVMKQGCVDDDMLVNEEERQVFNKWKANGFTRQDHPTIIQFFIRCS